MHSRPVFNSGDAPRRRTSGLASRAGPLATAGGLARPFATITQPRASAIGILRPRMRPLLLPPPETIRGVLRPYSRPVPTTGLFAQPVRMIWRITPDLNPAHPGMNHRAGVNREGVLRQTGSYACRSHACQLPLQRSGVLRHEFFCGHLLSQAGRVDARELRRAHAFCDHRHPNAGGAFKRAPGDRRALPLCPCCRRGGSALAR